MRRAALAATAAVLLLVPAFVTTPYFIHILVLTGMYIVLALSYDLSVGQVGVLSLAHPAFFGTGAYTAAILAVDYSGAPLLALGLGAVLASVLAVAIGVPSFRLSEHSFAIGTLGFALIAELVARNWIGVTRGPMGIPGIPRPVILGVRVSTLVDFYYLMLVMLGLAVAFYRALTTSRVGRAFRAVREDEVLAASAGVSPQKYKMIAFVVGAAMAGVMGVFYAWWFTIVSPEQLTMYYTVNLLIIVFIGGRGSLRGVILGAVIFTAVPEFLRIAPQARLILYGFILLASVHYFPDGLEGLLRRLFRPRSAPVVSTVGREGDVTRDVR
ncbi:MAG: branched-chain amino acid ABC transporter permease [Candidatus Rokubacteria bacterium]|nr:branched-chain amino acid ABC transporter permease [Candidatus Rokubacteria bacterium]